MTYMTGLDDYERSVDDLHNGVKKVRYHHGRTDGGDDDGDDRSVQSRVELFLPPTSSHTPLSPPPARFIDVDMNLGNTVGVGAMGTLASSLEGLDVNESCEENDDVNETQPRPQQKVTPTYRICIPIKHLH